MDKLEKLKLLGESAKYDVCASSSATPKKFKNADIGRTVPSGVCHSFTPDGRCVSLFKVLLSNQCEKDCLYCPNRAGCDIPRSRFAPEELADLFMEFYRRNYVEAPSTFSPNSPPPQPNTTPPSVLSGSPSKKRRKVLKMISKMQECSFSDRKSVV